MGILLVLGAAVRLYFAASFQFSMNSDYGIVALMVKHIVEGQALPVFFYGQAYMGSLEPLVSALFCKAFGLSTFNLCLGTAFLGMLLLPVIYAWGRDAGGRTAGVAALAFSLIGPVGYFHYLASPRGGYAATLLLGTLILWLSVRLAVREFRNDAVPPAWYALLGLIAGLGWWTNQLIAAALVTAGVLLLAALKFRVVTWRVPAGLAGFFIGSLPWWMWNFRHGWESLGFMGSVGRTPAGEGLKLFFVSRLPDLLDVAAMPWSFRVAGLTGIALLVVLAAWSLIYRWRQRQEPLLASVSLLTAFLFIAVSALLFCRAHFAVFNTSRYLLPIVPVLAVLVGVATAFLVARARYGLGWAPLLLMLVFQVWNARFTLEWRHNRTWDVMAQTLNRSLAGSGIQVVFCDYLYHWLNAATGERRPMVEITGERYRPYERRGEMARRVAFFGNVGDVGAFITNSGGSALRGEIMSFPVYAELQPPAPCGLMPPASWSAAVDSHGSNVLAAISDSDLQTRWQAPVLTNAAPWIEIAFNNPVSVQGVRFLSDNGAYPPAWAVESKTEEHQPWRALTPVMPITGYFWSGPRLYWNGSGFRPECRFKPETVLRFRVRFIAPDRESEVYVSELEILGETPAISAESEIEALSSLLIVLKDRGIRHLYSDRWVANEVATESGGAIFTTRDPAIFERQSGDPVQPRKRFLPVIRLNPHTAVLVRAEEAPVCRKNLAHRRIAMRETPVGPWILFDLTRGQWQPRYAADTGLFWTGFNILAGKRVGKRYAMDLMNLAAPLASIDLSRALLEEALTEAPAYAPLLQQLATVYKVCGETQKASALETRAAELTRPQTPASAAFGHGIELLGVTLDPREGRPGDTVAVRYYWRCPANLATARRPIVFVHFCHGARRFQDDHLLLAELNPDDIAVQGPDDVEVETRSVSIPADTEAGVYEIRLGLIDAITEKRWSVHTDLLTRHCAVIVPVECLIR